MTTTLLRSHNISLFTVPIAWALCLAPHVYAIKSHDAYSPTVKFDPVNPRTFLRTLETNPSLDEATKGRIGRAEASSLNGYENLGFFAAGVVAANCAGVDAWWCNVLSIGYLVNRVLYNELYLRGVRGPVRGAFFYGAISCVITLFIKARNGFRRVGA